MREEANINIPFRIVATEDSNGVPLAYVDNDDVEIIEHTTMARAKVRFKAQLIEEIGEALRAKKRAYIRRYIGMGDGSVFIVYWRGDAWVYDTVGAGRKYPGGASLMEKTPEEAMEYIKRSFADVMGGVVWEM